MAYINQYPELYTYFADLNERIRKLETAQRFTIPVLATDPVNRRNGDMWINSSTNQLKAVDSTGTIKIITWA
jgi:hypothetical protein